MSLISNLVILYAGILLINVALSGLLWLRSGGELHKQLFFVWATSCAGLMAQGIVTHGSLSIVLGFSVVYFINLALAQLVVGVVSISSSNKLFTIAFVASLIAASGLALLSSPFWLIALPVSVAVSIPLIVTASRALLLHREKLTVTGKALVVSCYLFSAHNLDFPFLRMRQSFAALGFTIALFIVITLSITAPAAVLERITEDRVRIEHLDRLRTQFFSNITHELRTPLTMIMAPLEGLLEGEIGNLRPQQKEYLRPIQRNALKLLKLINDLLDLSKMDEQYLRLRVEQTDLVGLVSDIAAQAQPLAARKDIALELELRRSEGDLQVDLERMERALVNLLSNALKFTDPGGRVKVWMDANDHEVQIGVQDSGIGIPQDQLELIFERFSQADESTTRRYGGTGIGLALAKEIVELHGGHITVDSLEGKGSKFVVHLRRGSGHLKPEILERRLSIHPAAVERRGEDREPREWTRLLLERKDYRFLEIAEATERRIATRGDSGPKPNKILVVEDNADVLRFINMQLSEDHDVYLAQDGAKGLELARRELPDVIITDYMMPEMDGLSLLRALRSDPRTKNIPAIMLTAKTQVQDRIDARQAGAEIYLSKPFSPRELRSAVGQLLERRGRQLSHTLHEQVKSLELISAGLAHEIHNPLSYIRSSLFVIEELVTQMYNAARDPDGAHTLVSLVQDSRDKIMRMHQIAKKGVGRIAQTVELVRTHAREGYVREPTALCIDSTITDMAPLLSPANDYDIHVELDLQAKAAHVSCIAVDMQRSISNLWQNALDAVGPGGQVAIRTRTEPGYVTIEVIDNGTGIPRDQLERIFVPFYTTKEPGKGLGLGLSIAYQVINQTGGSITVESVENSGTTFRVRLPTLPTKGPFNALTGQSRSEPLSQGTTS